MASISNTGQSSTQNYFIGRGCVFLAEIKDGMPGAWREVGNVADLNVEADSSTIEHYSTKGFTRVKDAEVLGEVSYNFSLTMDEWMYENLAAFFLGKADSYLQPAKAGATAFNAFGVPSAGKGSRIVFPNVDTTATDALSDTRIGGRYYDIHIVEEGGAPSLVIGSGGDTSLTQATRVYDIDLTGVTIAAEAQGDDNWYVVPGEGQIFVVAGGALDTALNTAGQTDGRLYVTAGVVTTAIDGNTIAASAFDQMAANTQDQATVAVKFVALNGNAAGEKHEMIIHQAKLRPQGSLGLIQEDDFGQIVLEGSMEQNSVADPDGGGFYTVRKIG